MLGGVGVRNILWGLDRGWSRRGIPDLGRIGGVLILAVYGRMTAAVVGEKKQVSFEWLRAGFPLPLSLQPLSRCQWHNYE